MKQTSNDKSKKNGYQSDDDNVRYKINTNIFNSDLKTSKSPKKSTIINDDNNVRYKLPSPPPQKPKSIERKPKPKPKIKVNFWSNKQSSRITKPEISNRSNRRHTVGSGIKEIFVKPKTSAVKVRKQVSFLPSPLFSDNHIPMVTVPDDLTIQLNEEEANDLADDLNLAHANRQLEQKSTESFKRKGRDTPNLTSLTGAKRKQNSDDTDPRHQGNDNELEFFSKYVVQKLRKMETNQRIYSENLINTVLMLGQLAKLNVKSKISDA